jgi:hypothetical protein
MVIIGGDADGNEEDVFFFIFFCVFELFSTYPCMLISFLCFLLLNYGYESQSLRRNSNRAANR